jgi:acyl-CoA dehydrogenase
MSAVAPHEALFLDEIRRIARETCSPTADEVDREARFPIESVNALREVGALSALVPTAYGGGGADLETVAAACFELGRSCSATAMIFAMHQIQIACIVRHGAGTPFFDDYLTRLATNQLLVASATSEVGVGGDLRASIAAVTPDGDSLVVEKNAPTVSYGSSADDLLLTARRAPDAGSSDQVAVLVSRNEMTLEPSSGWDPLGMRGTCSPGFVVTARFPADHIVPAAFGQIAERTMVPFSHILWAHVWLGIATDAYDRARAFVRGQNEQKGSSAVPTPRLAELAAMLHGMRAEIAAATGEYVGIAQVDDSGVDAFTIGYALRINALKINASELAPRVCAAALGVCGIAGYRNDSRFSIGRHLRDALSAPLMIANDRIHASNATMLLVSKDG